MRTTYFRPFIEAVFRRCEMLDFVLYDNLPARAASPYAIYDIKMTEEDNGTKAALTLTCFSDYYGSGGISDMMRGLLGALSDTGLRLTDGEKPVGLAACQASSIGYTDTNNGRAGQLELTFLLNGDAV